MDRIGNARLPLVEVKIHVKQKISALWTSAMFCYVYGDYFLLYQPGKLHDMINGEMAPLGKTTQGVLLFTSVAMAIPAAMIFLSLALPAKANRSLNIVVAAIYSLFVLVTMPGAWTFYLFFGTVDIILTLLIVWYAWNWPRQDASGDTIGDRPA